MQAPEAVNALQLHICFRKMTCPSLQPFIAYKIRTPESSPLRIISTWKSSISLNITFRTSSLQTYPSPLKLNGRSTLLQYHIIRCKPARLGEVSDSPIRVCLEPLWVQHRLTMQFPWKPRSTLRKCACYATSVWLSRENLCGSPTTAPPELTHVWGIPTQNQADS